RLSRKRGRPKTGIVHLGLGAFFRAHGAIYVKEAMEKSGGDWGVLGVSLKSAAVRDLLAPQDCLYTAVEMSENGIRPQVIDVVSEVLVAPENPEAVLREMASEHTRIVSLTITEKGYCRRADGATLDLNHPDILHDRTNALPRSAVGYITRALDIRRKRGLRPFTVMSLDNLPENGRITEQVVKDLATSIDADLADWITRECKFPSTMVDRIVPATTQAAIERLAVETGIFDSAAVMHEPFRQWVVEDQFVDDARPHFGRVGVQLVEDVKTFEQMKLRMLNGTHTAMAYIGSLSGHATVSDAINDPKIEAFLTAMLRDEIIPSLRAPDGIDLGNYATALIRRYHNPEIQHLLDQIATDGSQKLRQRILDPLFENLTTGRPYGKLLIVVAAWIRFLKERSEGGRIVDPLAAQLIHAIHESGDDTDPVRNILDLDHVFDGYPSRQILNDLTTTFRDMNQQFTKT
ncbi:UNVERIFIED_CONTAM: hypothetical protein GTU68_005954, partial [Idotea baltica]|nr:hypothetical protein [Idotea baltica]